jgi:hypothetical protein
VGTQQEATQMTTAPTTPAPLPRRRGRRRTVALVAGTAVLTLAGTALATGVLGPAAAPAAADGLTPFDDCAGVRDWYVEALDPGVGPYGVGGFAVPDVARAMEDSTVGGEADAGSGAPGAAVGAGATGTNLQEAGVDEPDTVKVDPTRPGLVVTTAGDRLVVVDVSTGEPRRVGSLQVTGLGSQAHAGWGGDVTSDTAVPVQPGTAEILLDGDRAVLLWQGWAAVPLRGQDQIGSPTTSTAVVDLADPAAPRLVSQQEVEGTLVGARLSAGVVRVVTSSTPVVVHPAGLDAGAPGWESDATVRQRTALAGMRGEQFLPATVTRDADGVVTGREPALSCSDLVHTSAPAGGGVLTVRSLDPAAQGDPVVDVAAVAADGDLVYASTDRLYVATTRGGWATWAGGPVEAVGEEQVRTELHGFDTGTGASTTYLASGEVEGYLLGRWALSARDGHLRVATTTGSMWADPQSQQEPSQSRVTVLAERDGALEQVGVVGGLGIGETIRSVRWFDDVATVVTFRQTDPLYVVDLSDPTAPVVTGELKVPGYSAYLHPVGDDRLLGVGQDATDTGRTTGVLVQTFDLSDPTAPAQLSTWTEADTWTAVESDSRQFTYLPDRRTALLPLDTANGTGLQAISLGQDGTLAEAGRYDLAAQQGWAYLVRAVAVGDRVVLLTGTETGAGLTVLDLDGLTPAGTTDLG